MTVHLYFTSGSGVSALVLNADCCCDLFAEFNQTTLGLTSMSAGRSICWTEQPRQKMHIVWHWISFHQSNQVCYSVLTECLIAMDGNCSRMTLTSLLSHCVINIRLLYACSKPALPVHRSVVYGANSTQSPQCLPQPGQSNRQEWVTIAGSWRREYSCNVCNHSSLY